MIRSIWLAATLAACGGAGAQSYAGEVQGSDAFLVIAIDGPDAVAYACNGTETQAATLAEWFEGDVAADQSFDLIGEDGSHVVGRVQSTSIAGTLTIGTGAMPIAIPLATPPSGLYRDDDSVAGSIGGWILLANGQQRGAIVRHNTDGTRSSVITKELDIVGGQAGAIDIEGVGIFSPREIISPREITSPR